MYGRLVAVASFIKAINEHQYRFIHGPVENFISRDFVNDPAQFPYNTVLFLAIIYTIKNTPPLHAIITFHWGNTDIFLVKFVFPKKFHFGDQWFVLLLWLTLTHFHLRNHEMWNTHVLLQQGPSIVKSLNFSRFESSLFCLATIVHNNLLLNHLHYSVILNILSWP